jgi:hypothetical protein
MTCMGACDSSTRDKFNSSTAKWFKSTRSAKSWMGTLGSNRTLVRIILAAPGDLIVCHETIPFHLAVTRGGAYHSSIYLAPKSASVAPKRASPTKPSPSQARTMITALASRFEHIFTRSGIHFPWWTSVELHLARKYDWLAVRERLVVIYRGETRSYRPQRRMASRRARMELVLERNRQG